MAKISLSYPDTGLSISISIKNRDTGAEEFLGNMIEIGSTGVYKYDFIETTSTDYIYTAQCSGYSPMNGILYSASGGLTTEEHDKLMSIGGGGIRSVGLDAIDKKYLKETHEKVLELKNTDLSQIDIKLNEINSHNKDIIEAIQESELEICSDIVRVKKELKEDNIATRNLIRQKTKKIDENTQKLVDGEEEIKKMIESEAEEIEIEKILNEEADMVEKEIDDQINKEADQIESALNSN